MVTPGRYPATNQHGRPCQSPPLKEGELCFIHSPEYAEEIAEARCLGGLRRRREVALAGAYEFNGLVAVAHIRRLLEVAVLDTLGLENSIARAHTLGYLVGVAIKLLEIGEQEQRLSALEGAVHGQIALPELVFDVNPEVSEFSVEIGNE